MRAMRLKMQPFDAMCIKVPRLHRVMMQITPVSAVKTIAVDSLVRPLMSERHLLRSFSVPDGRVDKALSRLRRGR